MKHDLVEKIVLVTSEHTIAVFKEHNVHTCEIAGSKIPQEECPGCEYDHVVEVLESIFRPSIPEESNGKEHSRNGKRT